MNDVIKKNIKSWVSGHRWPFAFSTDSVLVNVTNKSYSWYLCFLISITIRNKTAEIRKSLVPDISLQNSLKSLLLGLPSCLYHQPGKGNTANCKHSPPNLNSWASETAMLHWCSSQWPGRRQGLAQTPPAGQPHRWVYLSHPAGPTHNCLESSFSQIGPSHSQQTCEREKDFE